MSPKIHPMNADRKIIPCGGSTLRPIYPCLIALIFIASCLYNLAAILNSSLILPRPSCRPCSHSAVLMQPTHTLQYPQCLTVDAWRSPTHIKNTNSTMSPVILTVFKNLGGLIPTSIHFTAFRGFRRISKNPQDLQAVSTLLHQNTLVRFI